MHLLTSCWMIPSQSKSNNCLLSQFPHFYCSAWCHIACDIPFESVVLVLFPLNFLCTLSSLLEGKHEKLKFSCLWASATLQQLKHQCVINTVFNKNLEHAMHATAPRQPLLRKLTTRQNQERQPKTVKNMTDWEASYFFMCSRNYILTTSVECRVMVHPCHYYCAILHVQSSIFQ